MEKRAYVIGDLHLGGGRFGVECFDKDQVFADWVGSIQGAGVTLVINGNFIDFVRIPPFEVPESPSHLLWDEAASLLKLDLALKAHPQCFDALAAFVKSGSELVLLPGACDLDLAWPKVQARLREAIGEGIRFEIGRTQIDSVVITPGYQYAPESCPADPEHFVLPGPEGSGSGSYLERTWSTDFTLRVLLEVERDQPWISARVGPPVALLKQGLKQGLPWIRARHLVSLVTFLRGRGVPLAALSGQFLGDEEQEPQSVELSETEQDAALDEIRETFADGPLQEVVGSALEDPAFQREVIETIRTLPSHQRRQLVVPEGDTAEGFLSAPGTDMLGTVEQAQQRAAASELFAAGASHVVMGHTSDALDGDVNGRLFNPGNWISSIDLTDPRVQRLLSREGLSQRLLSDKTLYTSTCSAVRIERDASAQLSVGLVTIGAAPDNAAPRQRLSSPLTEIRSGYSVVVVGSGYGGGIAASRLSRAGQRVCVLERGREFLPGDFPNTLPSAAEQMQATTPDAHVGSHTALFDFRVDDDINVLQGCGLGGTSLINANVSIKPDLRVFEDPAWPKAFREDIEGRLNEGFRRAEEMLKPNPYPATSAQSAEASGFPELSKLQTLQRGADKLGARCYPLNINVTFDDKSAGNAVGVSQPACTLCGDCVSGCNYGSKNTVAMNYLPDAKNHGAQIFCEVRVSHVERVGGRYRVHFKPQGSGRDVFDAPDMFVLADVVVLAAGSLGSTEILLRSKRAGLSVSANLGRQFSGNADVLGFSYNNDEPVHAVGCGDAPPEKEAPVGPCITGVMDDRQHSDFNDDMIIEEGVIPGALAAILPETFDAAKVAVGTEANKSLSDWIQGRARYLQSALFGANQGAVAHSQTYLVMAHDGADGRLELEAEKLRIRWAGVGLRPIFESINERLESLAHVNGGTYIRSPLWTKLMKQHLVTVHPLGGCPMGDDANCGVVNHKGQVFTGADEKSVHEGLYVADGAVLPSSVGVNPLFSISAIAERCCALLAEDRGWNLYYDFGTVPTPLRSIMGMGVEFTEKMKGHFSKVSPDQAASSSDESSDPRDIARFLAASERGERANSPLEFVLTIRPPNVEVFLNTAEHQAPMVGTVVAPLLSPEPLMATEGRFNLFVNNSTEHATKNMVYRMLLTSKTGDRFFFHGYKVVRDDPGFDLWEDTTTLYISIHEGETQSAPVLGQGILKIEAQDFARQASTMTAFGAGNKLQQWEALFKFSRSFAGDLVDIYGGPFAKKWD